MPRPADGLARNWTGKQSFQNYRYEPYLLTNRYYDPSTGKFASRDPIGTEGGENLYGYAGDDPVNGVDPSGLETAGSFTSFSSYAGEVGDVFKGYGDQLNPVNAWNGAKALVSIGRQRGVGAAVTTAAKGLWTGLTAWTYTSQPRDFGRSFGSVLLTAATVAAPGAEVGAARVPLWQRVAWSSVPKASLQELPTLGMTTAEFGRFIGWGTTGSSALARAASLSDSDVAEMAARGLTRSVANRWAEGYLQQFKFLRGHGLSDPLGNPYGRYLLMKSVASRLPR